MEHERDFLMRQIHQFIQGIGRLMTRESLKELINIELDAEEALTDKEIDQLLLLTRLKEIVAEQQIDETLLQASIGMSESDIDAYYQLQELLSDDDYAKIEKFVNQHRS